MSAIKIHYISQWKPTERLSFELAGVIGVTADDVAVYAPSHSPYQASLKELLLDWNAVRSAWKSPLDWLTALAERGNGITVEYSPVRVLETEAASLAQALKVAYKQTKQEYGCETLPEPVEGEIEIVSVSASDRLPGAR